MKKCIIILLTFFSINIYAQDNTLGTMMESNIDIRVDSLGAGHISYTMKFNASVWQPINQLLGNNPALLKKGLEDEMPSAFLSDYKFEKNDFDRTIKLSFVAYGIGKMDKKGKWIFELDSKDPKTEQLGNNKFLNISTEDFGGIACNQRQIIELPSNASNAKMETSAQGKKQITCNIPIAGTNSGGIMKYIKLIGGGVLALAGLVWLVVVSKDNRSKQSLKVVTANEKVA
jgi:hypothetical protein